MIEKYVKAQKRAERKTILLTEGAGESVSRRRRRFYGMGAAVIIADFNKVKRAASGAVYRRQYAN